jgi:hypothetical protein
MGVGTCMHLLLFTLLQGAKQLLKDFLPPLPPPNLPLMNIPHHWLGKESIPVLELAMPPGGPVPAPWPDESWAGSHPKNAYCLFEFVRRQVAYVLCRDLCMYSLMMADEAKTGRSIL